MPRSLAPNPRSRQIDNAIRDPLLHLRKQFVRICSGPSRSILDRDDLRLLPATACNRPSAPARVLDYFPGGAWRCDDESRRFFFLHSSPQQQPSPPPAPTSQQATVSPKNSRSPPNLHPRSEERRVGK